MTFGVAHSESLAQRVALTAHFNPIENLRNAEQTDSENERING